MMNLGTDYKSVFLPNILSFWTSDVTNFSTVTQILSYYLSRPVKLDFQFFS